MHPRIVLVADGQPIVRWALRRVLTALQCVDEVVEAASRAELDQAVRRHRPEVVITDLQFHDGSVLDSMPRLTLQTRLIAFSSTDTWDRVQSFMDAGGMGFLSKRSSLDELTACLVAVLTDKRWIAPSVRSVSETATARVTEAGGLLTAREREVAALIAKGHTSRQIAEQLCISRKTVETHRYRIFRKLNIRHCAQLADYVVRNGLS